MSEWVDSLDPNLISLILPTYNRDRFLLSSLENIVRAQTVLSSPAKLEVIIVNDCSTQVTDMIISEFSELNIIHIKLPKNSGTVCIPRNIGISWANGRILAPTDDDCLVNPCKFEELFKLLNTRDDNVMAYGERDTYHSDKHGDFHLVNKSHTAHYQNMPHKKDVGIDNGQFIYRTDVYNTIDPSFSINACDWYTYSSFADLGNFAYTNQSVCSYLWHGGNISIRPAANRLNPLSILPDFLPYFKKGPYLDRCKSLCGS